MNLQKNYKFPTFAYLKMLKSTRKLHAYHLWLSTHYCQALLCLLPTRGFEGAPLHREPQLHLNPRLFTAIVTFATQFLSKSQK